MSVRAAPLPDGALLSRYADRQGSHTDCFETVLPFGVALPDYITAFYSTWLFRLERLVLTVLLRRRIPDASVLALADGRTDRFAAWKVEAREDTQILLCDLSGATRSYLAVEARENGTCLRFGSAVVGPAGGRPTAIYRVLMPLHLLYSRGLLGAAARRLANQRA